MGEPFFKRMNNNVELIGYYGSDETHALSAWTSTGRDLTDEKRNRIPALLKALADKKHHSVFEKSSLHFLVDCDVASHIHLLKHRIGVSLNAESARYKELKEDKYFIPKDWSGIEVNEGESSISDYDWAKALRAHTVIANELYHKCLEKLEPKLGRQRAKESARFFKTYNSQIQSDVMFNWRSFYHFLGLRRQPEAQKEIREIADEMLRLVKAIEGGPFKYTISAFGL